jgi:anti-sigma B factor antagonist
MLQPQPLGTTVVSLEGGFDFSSRQRITDAFLLAVSSPLVVVDLGQATYIDSTVLGCLLTLHKSAKAAGNSLVIAGASPFARRLFTITGLEKVFETPFSM